MRDTARHVTCHYNLEIWHMCNHHIILNVIFKTGELCVPQEPNLSNLIIISLQTMYDYLFYNYDIELVRHSIYSKH